MEASQCIRQPERVASFLQAKLDHLEDNRHVFDPSSSNGVENPIGLNILYMPPEPLVDLMFVHGLGGGSHKTWTRSDNINYFWPQMWLPNDPGFKHVRISTYGYYNESVPGNDRVFDINDIGVRLLSEMAASPLTKDNAETVIFLVGHGVGGLIIKKVLIASKEDEDGKYGNLSQRIRALFFFGTPHSGADSTLMLKNMQRASTQSSGRRFDEQSWRDPGQGQSINWEFQKHSEGIRLCSIYETAETDLGSSSGLVVDKKSAVMGSSEERVEESTASHQDMCSFSNLYDPNFRMVRNALVTTIDDVLQDSLAPSRKGYRDQVRLLKDYLCISDKPEEDLTKLEDLRTEGTCTWLTTKKDFYEWQEGLGRRSRYFWLKGAPAAGKSVLAAYVIDHLEALNRSCSYFFFKHADKFKSSLGDLLRSLAFQMALSHAKVREKLLELQQDSPYIWQTSSRTIWQKVFVDGILRVDLPQPHFWVVDALEECTDQDALSQFLGRIEQSFPLRIFVSSQATPELAEFFHHFTGAVLEERTSLENTMDDIKTYVDREDWRLPIEDCAARRSLVDKLVEKSNGCFLWAHLVLQELSEAGSEEDIEQILNDIPKGMNPLYTRMLGTLSTEPRPKGLVKAILTWATCATRPLSVLELREALKWHIQKHVLSLGPVIPKNCGQLVYVDKDDKVQLMHQTARQFLTGPSLETNFAIKPQQAHEELARACLQYLTRNEMKEPSYRSRQRGTSEVASPRSDFADYACAFFAEHLVLSNTRNKSVLDLLYQFLETNVLSWIEIIAQSQDLYPMIATAKHFRSYIETKAGREASAGKGTLAAWATDLLHLVARFGKNLISAPGSIHFLIPPFCPPTSAIFQAFATAPRGLTLKGLSARDWDDRLSCINYRNDQPSAVACRESRFAVGLTSGEVIIYHTSTCQEASRLHHGESVKLLHFGTTTRILASSGKQMIKIWNSTTGDQLHQTSMPHETIALGFLHGDRALMAATNKSSVATWEFQEDTELNIRVCYDPRQASRDNYRRAPSRAQFSIELNMLALECRGQPIGLWDLGSWSWLGFCRKGLGNVPAATALVFNPVADLNLLAAAYLDGDLVLYDLRSQEVKKLSGGVDAQVLAASPDGKMLACFSSSGSIQLYDFETLRKILAVPCRDDIKAMAFTSDSLRLFDIREDQCNVWEPSVLVRTEPIDNASESSFDTVSEPSRVVPFPAIVENKKIITSIGTYSSDFVICGKEDGSVAAYETNTGNQVKVLYRHATNVTVVFIATSGQTILASADTSSRVLVYNARVTAGKWSVRGAPTLDKRLGQTVRCIIPNSTLDKVLVNTTLQATLWNIKQAAVEEQFVGQEKDALWANYTHKKRPVLLALDRKAARVYDWENLPETIMPKNALTSTHAAPTNTADDLQRQQRYFELVAGLMKISEGKIDDLVPNLFAKLVKEVQMIVGTCGKFLVYLNWDKWICSVNWEGFASCEYRRHFFIPFDWLNPNTALIIRVTEAKDIVVGKGPEIAIIKNWLDFGESIKLGEQRSPSMTTS